MTHTTLDPSYEALVRALEVAAIEYENVARATYEFADLNIYHIARCVNRSMALRSQAERIRRYQTV